MCALTVTWRSWA